MPHFEEIKAKAASARFCQILLTGCFFFFCSQLIHGQNALKPTDFKQYGNWELTDKFFRPLGGSSDDVDAGGNLHYLKRLPENFEILFRWTEIGKANAEKFAGGLRFNIDDFYRVNSHSGAYGRKISCVLSRFTLNIHTKDPTLPSKINPSQQGDIVESSPQNFLKPPGKENQARLACFGNTMQVIVNDCLVYQFNIPILITERVEPNAYAGLGEDLKVWNDTRKRGLFLSVGLLTLKEDEDYGVINGISIRDFGKSADNNLSPLVDPKSSRYADWCKNDRWNFTDDKNYKRLNDLLIRKKSQFSKPGNDDIFPKFNNLTNPGGTNNATVIQSFFPDFFSQSSLANNLILSIFKCSINDNFQSRITIIQFKDEALANRYFDGCSHSFSQMITDGQIFQNINGKYVLIIYRNNMNAKKNDFLSFCKEISETIK